MSSWRQKCFDSEVVLWGHSLDALTPPAQLVVLGTAMFLCHLLRSLLVEHISHEFLSRTIWSLAAMELSACAILAELELRARRQAPASFGPRWPGPPGSNVD